MCCNSKRRPLVMEAKKLPSINVEEVEMNESISDLDKIFVGTEYEKSTKCIKEVLDHYGIKTLGQLANGPRILGTKVCGHSVWELISTIHDRTLNPPKAPKKVVILKPEPEVVEVVEVPTIIETPKEAKTFGTKDKKE